MTVFYFILRLIPYLNLKIFFFSHNLFNLSSSLPIRKNNVDLCQYRVNCVVALRVFFFLEGFGDTKGRKFINKDF